MGAIVEALLTQIIEVVLQVVSYVPAIVLMFILSLGQLHVDF
jgi:hypothetical protein